MKNLDQYHWHEVLDRTHITIELFEREVVKHKVIRFNPKLKEIANRAGTALMELYQEIGRTDPNWGER